jgi:hypothetical protein
MPQSNSVNVIAPALAKAQAKFEKITKNRVGQEGNQKFPYSTLSQVLEAVKPPLNEQGIFLSQPIVVDDKGSQRVTTKVQLGDEFIATDGVLLSAGLVGSKAFGREVTYSKRYDLMSFLGVCAEDDDEDAPDLKKVQEPNKTYTPQPPKPSFPKKIDTPKAAEKAVAKAVSEATDFPFGKNANTAVVGGAASGGNPEITDDDIPYFDTPITEQEPLSPEAEAAAQAMDAPETLSKERYDFIQERLKEISTQKLGGVTTKSLSAFLEARHRGKKLVYVPAVTAENTLNLVEEAVEGGPAKVKELFNSVKEKNG